MRLHFKHIFGTQVPDWGIVGFTSAQPAATALKQYAPGEIILLAIPQLPEPDFGAPDDLHGKIIGCCTLLRWDNPARHIANPERAKERPEVIARWSTAAPIEKFWRLADPLPYASIPGLAPRVQTHGTLVTLDIQELSDWYKSADWLTEPVYQSDAVKEAINRTHNRPG